MPTIAIQKSGSTSHMIRSGAMAGAFAAFAFAVIHDIFISDIWSMLIIMLVAGALCGLCIGWSYALLANKPTAGSWWRYNLLYVGLLALLGILSILIFEPTTTMAALVEANAPPDKLIGQALPMTALFTLLSAIVISSLYRASWLQFGVIFLTCVLLIFLLGLNVSVLGLVAIPRGSLYLIAEFFGLILALNLIYAATFTILERKRLLRRGLPAGVHYRKVKESA
jgi:hypothetical protein